MQLYLTVFNKVSNRVSYKLIAKLYATNYFSPPFPEYLCVNIPIKIKNNDRDIDHWGFITTAE